VASAAAGTPLPGSNPTPRTRGMLSPGATRPQVGALGWPERAPLPRHPQSHVAKSLSNPRIRAWLRKHGIEAVIPQRDGQRARHRGRPLQFNRQVYRRRNGVERCVGWPKENRRIATRYEKLAANYPGMLKLAMIMRYMAAEIPNRT